MRKLVRFSSILLLAAVLFSCKQNVNYDGLKSQEIHGQQTEKQVDKADDYVTVKLDVSKAGRAYRLLQWFKKSYRNNAVG